MKHGFMAVIVTVSIIGGSISNSIQAQVPVTWDGSAGINPVYGTLRWEDPNWTKDGIPGQTALATMGDNTGSRGGLDISIGGGAVVEFDHNDGGTVSGALGDFKPRMDLNGPGSLTIKEGAVLWMDSHSDADGRWTRVGLNINLDNGTLRRTFDPSKCPPSECSVTGGRLIFGYQNELLPDTKIEINLTNGGRIESHGKVVFGNPDFHEEPDNPSTGHNPGIEVAMMINNGTLDLSGGDAYPDFFGLVDGELIFIYEYYAGVGPKNEKYSVNFAGPGSIVVDTGIFVAEQDAAGVYAPHHELDAMAVPDLYTSLRYQDLWNLGILQANGQSGMTGATFGDYFTTSGAPGLDDYTLTSLLAAPGLAGDYNDNGVVDAADYVLWRKGGPLANEVADPGVASAADYMEWRARFGNSSGSGSVQFGAGGAVPEPASLLLGLFGMAATWLDRRFKRFA